MTDPRPRLVIIAFSRLVSDARVLKQIARFRDRYAVTTIGYGPAPEGVAEHCAIPDDAPLWRWRRVAVILRQYRRAYRMNAALVAARAALRGREIHAILANDIESAGIALEAVSPERVHLDLHEYAPRQREELWRWRVFVAPFVRWMARRHAARIPSVSTVSPGLAREYRAEFGIEASVVTNAAPAIDRDPHATGTPIRLVHSGAGLANRGLALMVEAVERSTADVSLDLFLTPNDPRFMLELAELCAASERCTLHPPVPYDELADTIARYDVGVFVLPPVNVNYRWALPNKLFDFVQARLGVIVGPTPDMAAIVREHGLGAVVDDFTAAALTRELDGLTPATVDAWKAASHRSARALSAELEVEKWASAIDAIVSRER